jgi:hypothetical protein
MDAQLVAYDPDDVGSVSLIFHYRDSSEVKKHSYSPRRAGTIPFSARIRDSGVYLMYCRKKKPRCRFLACQYRRRRNAYLRMRSPIAPLLISSCIALSGDAAIILTAATTDWKPILYLNAVSDHHADTQANIADLELVGDATHPAFYKHFDDGGTPDNRTDGQISFRMRMSGNQGAAGFHGQAWVGIDLQLDGAIDLFIGASEDRISIHGSGKDRNNSPKSTAIEKKAFWQTDAEAANFNWQPVTFELDPAALSTDLDAAGGNDYFLSFSLPFSTLVNAVEELTGMRGFDDTRTLSYIAATATQGNKINADINGLEGGLDANESWPDLEVLSVETHVDGTPTVIPEPAAATLAGGVGALLALFLLHRRRAFRNVAG